MPHISISFAFGVAIALAWVLYLALIAVRSVRYDRRVRYYLESGRTRDEARALAERDFRR